MILVDYKKKKDCLIFNDKENWIPALWFLAFTIFFFYIGVRFRIDAGRFSLLVIAPFILSFIFLISLIDRVFIYDLVINKKTNNARVKNMFIPLLLHNISLKECSKLMIYTIERVHIGHAARFTDKTVFLGVLLKKNKQKTLEAFSVPIKLLSDNNKITEGLLELKKELEAELKYPIELKIGTKQ